MSRASGVPGRPQRNRNDIPDLLTAESGFLNKQCSILDFEGSEYER